MKSDEPNLFADSEFVQEELERIFGNDDEQEGEEPSFEVEAEDSHGPLLPMLLLDDMVLLPYLNLTFDIVSDRSKEVISEVLDREDMRLFVTGAEAREYIMVRKETVSRIGCLAKLKQVVEINESGVLRITLEGLARARITDEGLEHFNERETIVEKVETLLPSGREVNKAEAMRRSLLENYRIYMVESGRQNEDNLDVLADEEDSEILCDKIAGRIYTATKARQAFLEETDLLKRMFMLLQTLAREIDIVRYGKVLSKKVSQQIDKNQRDYFLREQIKVINAELGSEADNQSAADEYREKLDGLDIDDKSREKLEKEIDRLSIYSPQSPETGVIRTYLDTVFDLPWGNFNELHYDLKKIRAALDKDHYGLNQVKERILEFIAVEKLRRKKNDFGSKGPILCLVGPPGVGKTSIASSIADAMGRDFVRMSLGGVRDEAEIRGHRKTYIGAMPGRIINALIQAGSDNPLILMDEIDKLAADYKGDPTSALLEVLDPEQNNTFRDHYLELPYDLSHVLFITTANRADQIPPALYDRMEVIELNGYTVPEKYEIAKRHLLPKQMRQNALEKTELTIYKSAMLDLISSYTAEAGVRRLEQNLAKICRRAALEIAGAENTSAETGGADASGGPEDKKEKRKPAAESQKKIKVTSRNLERYAGKPKYHYDKAGKKAISGLVRGLAWTAAGGDTLEIEALTMPGKGRLQITGQLGDVMKESCQVALAYVRAKSGLFGIEEDFFEKHDIHVHVPEGATPKDGPSAGITLVTAIMSAVTKRKVEPSLAMTGEVTLRGRVLAIGGLKEKLIAADRAQIKTVIIPEENRRDIDEVPESVRSKLKIHYVSDAEEVLDLVLGK